MKPFIIDDISDRHSLGWKTRAASTVYIFLILSQSSMKIKILSMLYKHVFVKKDNFNGQLDNHLFSFESIDF
jgi:hypothetical protein